MIRLDATVHGVVQGVGFRVFVMDAALRAGVRGWVGNQGAGSLRCVAEGERDALEGLLVALRRGPAAASIDRVTEAWMPATGEFDGFTIRSGWHSGD